MSWTLQHIFGVAHAASTAKIQHLHNCSEAVKNDPAAAQLFQVLVTIYLPESVQPALYYHFYTNALPRILPKPILTLQAEYLTNLLELTRCKPPNLVYSYSQYEKESLLHKVDKVLAQNRIELIKTKYLRIIKHCGQPEWALEFVNLLAKDDSDIQDLVNGLIIPFSKYMEFLTINSSNHPLNSLEEFSKASPDTIVTCFIQLASILVSLKEIFEQLLMPYIDINFKNSSKAQLDELWLNIWQEVFKLELPLILNFVSEWQAPNNSICTGMLQITLKACLKNKTISHTELIRLLYVAKKRNLYTEEGQTEDSTTIKLLHLIQHDCPIDEYTPTIDKLNILEKALTSLQIFSKYGVENFTLKSMLHEMNNPSIFVVYKIEKNIDNEGVTESMWREIVLDVEWLLNNCFQKLPSRPIAKRIFEIICKSFPKLFDEIIKDSSLVKIKLSKEECLDIITQNWREAIDVSTSMNGLKIVKELANIIPDDCKEKAAFQSFVWVCQTLEENNLKIDKTQPFFLRDIYYITDPLSLISQLLIENPKSYKKFNIFLKLCTDLSVALGTKIDAFLLKARLVATTVEVALTENDVDFAAKLCRELITPDVDNRPEIRDLAWKACFQTSHWQKKQSDERNFLVFNAIKYCPSEQMMQVAEQWRKFEFTDEKHDFSDLSSSEKTETSSVVDQTFNRISERNWFNPESLSQSMTHKVASGLGWILGIDS